MKELCKEIKKEIRDAVYTSQDFVAHWNGEDYVGGICDREGLDIDSPLVSNFVFNCLVEYNTICK